LNHETPAYFSKCVPFFSHIHSQLYKDDLPDNYYLILGTQSASLGTPKI